MFGYYGVHPESCPENFAKVGVEGSNPFARSSFFKKIKSLEDHSPTAGADFAVFGSPEGHFRWIL